MKLITVDFEELFKDYHPLYSQEHEKDPKVVAKFLIQLGVRPGF